MQTKITIPGEPATKGSTRSFTSARTGKVVTLPASNRTDEYEARVKLAARQKWEGKPTRLPVRLCITFWLKRPKSHYRSGRYSRYVRHKAPFEHVKRPDLDKLLRAILDGLTGVIYEDDSQVYDIKASKFYSGEPRTALLVEVDQPRRLPIEIVD